jgi:hypothetical protein
MRILLALLLKRCAVGEEQTCRPLGFQKGFKRNNASPPFANAHSTRFFNGDVLLGTENPGPVRRDRLWEGRTRRRRRSQRLIYSISSEREHLTRQPIRRPVRSRDMVGLNALLLTTSAAIRAHFFWLKSSSRTFLAVKRRVSVTQVDESGFEALVTVGEVLVVDWISLSL